MKNRKFGTGLRAAILAFLIAVILFVLPVLTGSAAQAASNSYVKTNQASVNFRKGANLSSDVWASLPSGWVLKYNGTSIKDGGYTWLSVTANIPGHLYTNYSGYISSSFVTTLTTAEANQWESYPVQKGCTPSPVPAVSGSYAIITADGVNMRSYAPGGDVMCVIKQNVVVRVISAPTNSYGWFYINYNNMNGYVWNEFARLLTDEELIQRGLMTATPSFVTATPTHSSGSGDGICKLAKDAVRFRSTPNGNIIATLSKGTTFTYWGTGTMGSDGYLWFQVSYNGTMGYVRKDMLTFLDPSGKVTTAPTISKNTPTPAPTTTVIPDATEYVILTAGGINFRRTAGGDILGRLDKGTILPYHGTDNTGKWALVYSNIYGLGYVSTDYTKKYNPPGSNTPTPAPVVTPTPAPLTNGYVLITKNAVNLRAQTSTSSNVVAQLSNGTVCYLTQPPIMSGSYMWYPVRTMNNLNGYVRGDVAYVLADWQVQYYLQHGVVPTPSAGPTSTPSGNSPYIRITASGTINVRSSSTTTSSVVGTTSNGRVYKYLATAKVGSYTWYKIQYTSSKVGWVRNDLMKVMSWAEYYAWAGTATPTKGNTVSPVITPSVTSPYSSDLSDMAVTTVEGLNVRSGAGTSFTRVGNISAKGTYVTYLQKSSTVGNETWYFIESGNMQGWVLSKYINIYTNRQKTAYLQSGDPYVIPEASYTTLSLGSTGNAVTVLQKELVTKGYLSAADVTGQYLSSTVNAVKQFQAAKGLTVDGIAGDATQHALFNTVPAGSNQGSTVIPDLKPVEMVDWVTGDIQKVWLKGETAIVTDVETGLSFRARRWSGGLHADVEPLTAADSAVMCKIYGVSIAQDIADLNLYQRHPIWVTIANRTFAASMYGCPHNYPEGDTIPDNNFYGQFCIHFVNSRVHRTEKIDADHQAAIKYAYQHSISGQK